LKSPAISKRYASYAPQTFDEIKIRLPPEIGTYFLLIMVNWVWEAIAK
jgi:hypothetical protein